jgi:putative tryptophan/tyrosine transport system substrate-binding protein
MRRREFIAGLGSAAACPVVARAQQPALPVIGCLFPGSPDPGGLAAYRTGLSEMGYAEGRNVTIEVHGGDLSRFPELAADLVRRQVAFLVTSGTPAAIAAAARSRAISPCSFRSNTRWS